MIFKAKLQIVIIDDDIFSADDEPLVQSLEIQYGKENIHIFQKPQDGIIFIENNLSKKTIVLLDVMFGRKPEGLKVFDMIMQKTALVCFILITGSIERIERKELVNLINKHAWYFVDKDETTEAIMNIVRNAEINLGSRVDVALEEWILRHNTFKREQPYIKLANGKTLSLNDVLQEIRLDTDFGREMQKNILSIAITKLQKDAEKLDN